DQCLNSGRAIVRRVVEMPVGHTGASHVGLTVSPLFGESSDVQGAICLFTDLTAVVALEEQLRLKDSLARVGELTAGIAHEFRNAIEACAAAGTAPSVVIEADIDRTQGVCILAIRDNGPGFAEAVRDRVFHPFFTTKPQGTGLGLALVQKIVVTHIGRVVAGTGPG